MKDKRTASSFKMIMRLKDPLQIFDLICVANYFAGNFGLDAPVDESREAFGRIKKLIITQSAKGARKDE